MPATRRVTVKLEDRLVPEHDEQGVTKRSEINGGGTLSGAGERHPFEHATVGAIEYEQLVAEGLVPRALVHQGAVVRPSDVMDHLERAGSGFA
jgi:hypothetical protein